jgi:hypothetical protein
MLLQMLYQAALTSDLFKETKDAACQAFASFINKLPEIELEKSLQAIEVVKQRVQDQATSKLDREDALEFLAWV